MSKSKGYPWNPILKFEGEKAFSLAQRKNQLDKLVILDHRDDPKTSPTTPEQIQVLIKEHPEQVTFQMFVPKPSSRPEVELVGQNGNANVLLGLCDRAARNDDWTPLQRKIWLNLARSGDYNYLLQCCMEYFEVS